MGRISKKSSKNKKPLVSVCTPTFNRRPFFKTIIKCFQNQNYPKDKMEWIIVDDGTDPIEDIINELNDSRIKYYKFDEKQTLGKKRNFMHEKASGDIIVYMDDDDYYPPQRVSHAVDVLLKNKKYLIAGSSELFIWFNHAKQMMKFGPYWDNHATAGTFAFKKELLLQTRYNDEASLAEEKEFLKKYSIPLIQLNPKYCILVFSHSQNTYDKRELYNKGETSTQKMSDLKPKDFIKDDEIYDFFINKMDEKLLMYEEGTVKYKPDVIKQTREIKEKREEMARNNTPITTTDSCGNKKVLTNTEIVKIIESQQNQLKQNQELLNMMNNKINSLQKIINDKDNEILQIKENIEITENVKDKVETETTNSNDNQITYKDQNGNTHILSNIELYNLIQKCKLEIERNKQIINSKDNEILKKNEQISLMQIEFNKISTFMNNITNEKI
jgi:glycosyltransferase involved in cell wall biosynthesis